MLTTSEETGRLFYFIATRPYLEKAVDDCVYLVPKDALEECKALNDEYPHVTWHVFQAEAVNVTLYKETS